MNAIIRSLRTFNKTVSCWPATHSTSFLNPKRQGRGIHFLKRYNSTLGQSFVLIQDGIEIMEMPWVVKRLNSSELFVNENSTTENAASCIRPPDDSESEFAKRLQECNSVKEVIQLLEVPGEAVTSQSAASALCRIGMLKSQSTEDLDSFIRKAVLNELCETIVKDFKALPNQTVIRLTGCCLRPNSYEEKFVEKVVSGHEYRIAASVYSISELCSLITMLSESINNNNKFAETVELCWIHLGSRFLDINESNIGEVVQVLQYSTPKFRYLLRVIDKQIQTCWLKLKPADVAAISKWLSFFNVYSGRTLSLLGRWLYTDVHSLTDEQMWHVLGMYLHFNFSDENISASLEKFIKAFSRRTVRGSNKSKDRVLMQMAATFCRQKRWQSPTILNSIALDFSFSPNLYGPAEGLSVLKTFGQLGFVPQNSSKFFSAAENWIELNLEQLKFADLLELLTSLVYIERFPVNFVQRVLSMDFPIAFKDMSDPVMRNRTSKHLLELQASHLLEFPWKSQVPFFFKDTLHVSLTWLDDRSFRFHKEVLSFLRDLLGIKRFSELNTAKHTPHLMNFEFALDDDKNPIKLSDLESIQSKLAIILEMPEHLNSNGSPVGEYIMKKRHLKKLGYETISINYETFSWKCRSHAERLHYLRSILSGRINFKN